MSEIQTINKEIENLENIYEDMTYDEKGRYIGGYAALNDFSKKWSAVSKIHQELKIPAFIISQVFKRIADNQFDRRVDFKESQKIYEHLNTPLKNLFNDIKTGSDYHKNLKITIEEFEDFFNE